MVYKWLEALGLKSDANLLLKGKTPLVEKSSSIP